MLIAAPPASRATSCGCHLEDTPPKVGGIEHWLTLGAFNNSLLGRGSQKGRMNVGDAGLCAGKGPALDITALQDRVESHKADHNCHCKRARLFTVPLLSEQRYYPLRPSFEAALLRRDLAIHHHN